MKKFSKSWKGSKLARKQRKYRFNMPLHLKGKLMRTHLSKELRKKYGTRSIRARKGDKVRILVGQFKKREGKIDRIDMSRLKVYVENVEMLKKDGSKTLYPIDPSNLLIMELNTDDKKRLAKFAAKKQEPAKDAKPSKK
jgi:large subunit ribosomal protein L24